MQPTAKTPQGELMDIAVEVLDSAPVQSALLLAITNGEVTLEHIVDAAISNAKAGGVLGLVISASKGSFEAEFNTKITKLPASTIAAWLTAQAQAEAKALGG